MCLKHFTGTESKGADGMCTVFKRDLTHFPTDGVIKAYMLFCGWKKKKSESPMSQDQVWKPSEPGVRGPQRGPDPSQTDPENPNMTEGALTGHRYHQSFEKMERRNDSVRKKK